MVQGTAIVTIEDEYELVRASDSVVYSDIARVISLRIINIITDWCHFQ